MMNLVEDMSVILYVLELQGYDEHPEIEKLIKDTKSLYLEAGECTEQLFRKYDG